MTDEELKALIGGTAPQHPDDASLRAMIESTEAPQGMAYRAAQYLGEKGADAVTGGSILGQIFDPVVAGAGAVLGEAFDQNKQNLSDISWKDIKERFGEEMKGLRRRRGEAFDRSPVLATGTALGAALLGGAPAITPLSNMASQASGAIPLLTRAVAGVGDAALNNAASSAAGNIDQDPLAAAKEAGSSKWNLLGAAPAFLSRGAAQAAPGLEDTSKTLAASTIKGTAGEYKSLGPEQTRELGDWMLRNNAVGAFDNAKTVAGKVDKLRQAAADNYGKVLQQLDEAGVKVDPQVLRDQFLAAALEAEKKGPAARPVVDQYLRAAADVEQEAAKAGKLSASDAELWKQGYQDVAYPKGQKPISPTPSQATDMDIARIAKGAVEQAAEQGAGETGLSDAFRAAKKDYGAAKTLTRMGRGAEARAEARNMAAPSDKMAALAALVETHNPIAALAVGALNNQVRTRSAAALANATSGMASGADAFGKMSPSEVNRLGSLFGVAMRGQAPMTPQDMTPEQQEELLNLLVARK